MELEIDANQTYKAYIKVLNTLTRNRTWESSNYLSIGSIAAIPVSSAAAVLFLCLEDGVEDVLLGRFFDVHSRRFHALVLLMPVVIRPRAWVYNFLQLFWEVQ